MVRNNRKVNGHISLKSGCEETARAYDVSRRVYREKISEAEEDERRGKGLWPVSTWNVVRAMKIITLHLKLSR